MQKLPFACGICVGIGILLSWNQQEASAQSCHYYAGTSAAGQAINVDTCSISIASRQSVDFVYYLGDEKVVSQANCRNGTWTTLPERDVHRPQSQATRSMLSVVCSSLTANSNDTASSTRAFVFDPPSNVRTSPNGRVICAVTTPTTINIYGSASDSWYYTDACGRTGVIHSSQIQF